MSDDIDTRYAAALARINAENRPSAPIVPIVPLRLRPYQPASRRLPMPHQLPIWSAERLELLCREYPDADLVALLFKLNALPGDPITRPYMQGKASALKVRRSPAAMTATNLVAKQRRAARLLA